MFLILPCQIGKKIIHKRTERPSDVTRKFPSDVTRYLFLSCDANASCLFRYDIRRHRTCMNEPSGQMRDETLHAVLARSTFGSQNVPDTPTPDHFSKYTTSTLIPQHYTTSTSTTTTTALHSIPLHSTQLHSTPLHFTTLHYTRLESSCG